MIELLFSLLGFCLGCLFQIFLWKSTIKDGVVHFDDTSYWCREVDWKSNNKTEENES